MFKFNVADALFEFSEDLQKRVLSEYVEEIHKEWVRLASQEIKSNKDLYLKGIKLEELNDFEYEFKLEGKLPNMMEEGSPSFDMKEGFSESSKKKQGKNGWYLIIPMKYATRSSNKSNLPAMPRSVYEAIRKEKSKKLNVLPPKYSKTGVNKTTNYQHKTPIYKGLQKVGNGYMTFRVVSQKSDPSSWIHPGFQPANILDKAVESVNFESILSRIQSL